LEAVERQLARLRNGGVDVVGEGAQVDARVE
jgi:hypothetical protein